MKIPLLLTHTFLLIQESRAFFLLLPPVLLVLTISAVTLN